MPGTTTDGDPIAAANSARPGPTDPVADLSQKQIKRRPVLGGLINEYERATEAEVRNGGRVLEPHRTTGSGTGQWTTLECSRRPRIKLGQNERQDNGGDGPSSADPCCCRLSEIKCDQNAYHNSAS
jgi:hypothetical protein